MIESWEDAYEAWDDMLDEEPVKIGSLSYSTSRTLLKIDPIAYREGLLDFLDSEGVDTDELTGRDDRSVLGGVS